MIKRKSHIFYFLICLLVSINSIAQNRYNKYLEIYDELNIRAGHIGAEIVKLTDSTCLVTSLCVSDSLLDTLGYYKSYIAISILNKNGVKIDSNLISFKGNYLLPNMLLKYDSSQIFIAGDITNYKLLKEKRIGSNALLVKINSDGDTIWSKVYSFDKDFDYVRDLIKTEDGRIIIFGSKCPYGTSPTRCDMYIIKVDTNGNEIFRKLYYNTSSSYDNAGGIVSGNNQLFAFGTVDTTSYNLKPFIFKIDKDGNEIKKKAFRDFDLPEDAFFPEKLLLDKNGGLLMVSTVRYDIDFELKGRLIKLDSNLNVQWEKTFDGLANSISGAIKFNNKYVIFGSQDVIGNKSLGFVKVYRENGNKVFERWYALPTNQFKGGRINSIKFINDSTLLATGDASLENPSFTQKTWIFTIDTFGCLEPGCPILGIENVPFNLEPLKIYPNPTVDFIKIDHSVKLNTYQIMDLQGAKLLQGDYSNEGIDVRKLPTGLYFVQVLLDDGTQSVVKFRKE